MATRCCRIIVRSALAWLLALVVVAFTRRTLPAAAQSGALDARRVDAFVRQEVQRHGIPGLALGLVEGDQIVYLQGYGKADQSGRAVTPQTPFLLASVSKPLTALAIMQLVEAGEVALDAPVQRYIPTFRLADPVASQQITVRHLLLHTSGIPVTACDTRTDANTLEQYVAELQTVKPDAPAGARHNYCSGNYNVLGRIIEMVTGQSFAAYMQAHLFAPLAMHHSFTSETEARQDGMAQGYQWIFGLVVPMHYRYNPSQLPSGALIASAEDMSHFLIASLNGGRFGATSLLSPEGIAAMQTPGVSRGDGSGYGFGWVIGPLGGTPFVYHEGADFTTRTFLLMQPATRRGAVLLLNSFGALASFGAFKEIEEGVARLLAGQEPAPVASLSLPMICLLVDIALALPLALALWPLLRMWRWIQQIRRRYDGGRRALLLAGLRIGWEFALPLALLIGARWALNILGAQSWAEGLSVFPDFGVWLWALSLLVLLTGAIRLVLLLGVVRRSGGQRRTVHPAAPAV